MYFRKVIHIRAEEALAKKLYKGVSGVYVFTNMNTGKRYVGSATKCLHIRWKNHITQLRSGRHGNKYFQNSWNKHGEKAFTVGVIEKCEASLCVSREQYWINKLKAANPKHGYNRSPTAGNCLGTVHGPEARANMAAAHVGSLTPAHREKMVTALRTEEVREKIRRTRLGTTLKEATKKKIGDAHRGKTLTEEHKSKIAASHIGITHSEEAKLKIGKAQIGKKLKEVTKLKIGNSLRGKKKSPEATANVRKAKALLKDNPEFKAKMSERMKLWWVERKRANVLS